MAFNEFWKAHWFAILILFLSSAVAVFLGVYAGRMVKLSVPSSVTVVHDTIYLRPSYSDSLLLDISSQVKEINSKIPKNKPVIRKRSVKRDTIKVDATIHLEQVGESK